MIIVPALLNNGDELPFVSSITLFFSFTFPFESFITIVGENLNLVVICECSISILPLVDDTTPLEYNPKPLILDDETKTVYMNAINHDLKDHAILLLNSIKE
jgi:hypothetical protein